jgi:hypothetical protein
MASDRKRRTGSRRVGDLMTSAESGLGGLLAVARRLDGVDRQLQALLDPGMAGQVRAAALRDGELLLVTPSATLATRLRLDAEHLVRALQAAGERSVTTLAVRVAPLPTVHTEPRKPRPLSPAARELFARFEADAQKQREGPPAEPKKQG